LKLDRIRSRRGWDCFQYTHLRGGGGGVSPEFKIGEIGVGDPHPRRKNPENKRSYQRGGRGEESPSPERSWGETQGEIRRSVARGGNPTNRKRALSPHVF